MEYQFLSDQDLDLAPGIEIAPHWDNMCDRVPLMEGHISIHMGRNFSKYVLTAFIYTFTAGKIRNP
jgi:hypothetical protein